MKLNQIRNLVAIAERGSLRAAAPHIGLAQPAVSRSLQELEHDLGVPLFERNSRGMILTPIGASFLRRASVILTEVRHAQEEVEQLHGGTTGTVVAALSIIPHIALLPQAIRPFRARYPKIQLHLIEGLFPTVEMGLRDGNIDFYVGPPPERGLSHDLIQEKLFDNRRIILCRKQHPLANATSLRELTSSEWLTTSITHRAIDELAEVFSGNGLPAPRLAVRSQSALTMIVALMNSDLLAMVPRQWTSFPVTADALVAIPIRESLISAPTVTIRRAGLPLTPAAEFLIDLIRRGQSGGGPASSKRERQAPAKKAAARRKSR
jgi:LysR family transcriptional regulator of abg operon